MKNLQLVTEQIGQLWPADAAAADTCIACTCVDSATQTVYVVTDAQQYIVYDTHTATVRHTLSLLTSDTQTESYSTDDGLLRSDDTALSCTYLAELESVVIGTKYGNILCVSSSSQIDNVGYFADGISCMQWSSDEEICCVVTGVGNLLLLTNEYDILYEVSLDEHNASTQLPNHTHLHSLCSWRGDGQYIAINTMYTNTSTNKLQRTLRVYNRNAELTSASEVYDAAHNSLDDGISSTLAWKPSGSVIVCTQRQTVDAAKQLIKHEVIMFERNGLRHGEFSLPNLLSNQHDHNTASIAIRTPESAQHDELKSGEIDDRQRTGKGDELTVDLNDFAAVQAQWNTTVHSNISDANVHVLSLQWNCDSDILSVMYLAVDTNQMFIQHYMQSNWHWYLKQQIALGTHGGVLLWDNEQGLRCTVLHHRTGQLFSMQYAWDVDVSTEVDHVTAVVDANNLLITPLARMVVPPPMSHQTVPHRHPIRQVTFPECLSFKKQRFTRSSRLADLAAVPAAVLMFDNTLLLYSDIQQYQTHRPVVLNLCNSTTRLQNVRHITWLTNTHSDSTYCIVLVNADAAGDSVVEVHIAADGTNGRIYDMFSTPIPQRQTVLRTYSHQATSAVYVQLSSGAVYNYQPVYWQCSDHINAHDAIPALQHYYTLPKPCVHFSFITLASTLHIVGRDTHGRLFIDDTLISPQCSSYTTIHPAYLMFTVSGQQNALFFISRQLSLQQNLDPEIRSDATSVRLMERGCTLICAIPDTTQPRVITQMPRGNLETVYPRVLSLLSINTALQQHKYKLAFVTAKLNRIDFNLLVDHSAAEFVQHVHKFVTDIDNVDYINLFIASLNNKDITETDFSHYHNLTRPKQTSTEPVDPQKLLRQSLEQDTLTAGLQSNSATIELPHANKTFKSKTPGVDRRTVFNQKLKEQAAVQYEQSVVAIAKTDGLSKVNRICKLMRETMQSVDANKFTLSILTTYLKQEPADYVSALQLVQSLRAEEHTAQHNVRTIKLLNNKPVKVEQPPPTRFITGHEALKYIIFLSDIYSLYTTALALYDFDLVMLVVQYSAYDVKEILGILSDFAQHARTPYYQRYQIDLHLKKYSVAIHNLLCSIVAEEKIDEEKQFKTALELIKVHHLYLPALEQLQSYTPAYSNAKTYYRRVLIAYADHLFSDNSYAQAAVAYIAASDLQNALRAYKSALNVDQCLILAAQLKCSMNDTQQLIYDLVEQLQSVRPVEAARLLVHQCDDADRAVEILCKTEHWSVALSVCHTQQRDDLIETHVQPEVRHAFERRSTQIDQLHQHYQYCINRLRLIRRVKLLFPPTEQEYELLGVDERDDDLQSIVSGVQSHNDIASSVASSTASTASSMFSVVSSTASMVGLTKDEKRIKKAQQRRLRKNKQVKRVKEGSTHEEAYLVNELLMCTPNIKLKQLVAGLVGVLIQFKHVSDAAALQNKFSVFLQYIKSEELKPMPALANGTAEQNEALVKRWNWPASSYPEPVLPHEALADNTAYTLPFLLDNQALVAGSVPEIKGISSKQVDELLKTVDKDIDVEPVVERKEAGDSKSGTKKGGVEVEFD